ncbi:MAG TPA: type IV secretion system DNA-binding domain-containing protein, partial [Phototrophicaceae bacterium]|nr:type IV secretion system DNA-binding domain-containing protein [Phototrophicaceae bacterium]
LTLEAFNLLTRFPEPTPATLELQSALNQRVLALAEQTVAYLLRIGFSIQANTLLIQCAKAKITSARLDLLTAERRADQPGLSGQALAAYRRALAKQTSGKAPTITTEAARSLLVALKGMQITCRHCGKTVPLDSALCPFCETSLLQRKLHMDEYPDASEAALAHIGMGDVLVVMGERDQALDHYQRAGDLLPDHSRALHLLNTLHEQIIVKTVSTPEREVQQIVWALDEQGVSAEVVARISRINQRQPDEWQALAAAQRARLMRRLIEAAQLKLADETLAVAFTAQSKLGNKLRQQLDSAVDQVVETALIDMEQQAPELGIAVASQALDLWADARLYQARGRLRLQTGADLAALEDFYAAVAHARDADQRYAARKAAALVLERRWNVSGARAILDLLDPNDVDVRSAYDRLGRRERGEPFVLTTQVADGVMEDTLLRRSLPPYTHGYFALALREVGYAGGDTWAQKLINANFEFVRVLGALRNVMGDAVFVLRMISQPHYQIPERGSLTLTLLVRVSAQGEDEARDRALQLWTDIHAILPLAQENVYVFEPVVDGDELQALLTPFAVTHAAEIARRAQAEVYAPFVPETLDLHNLYWMLLRQVAPAMISIHLKPTHLLPWERGAALYGDSARESAGEIYGFPELPAPSDHLDQPRALAQLWERLEFQEMQMHSLNAAYLLRIYVAGSAGTSQLLPEMAAAALFAAQQVNGQLGGSEIIRAGSPDEFAVITRNLSALDVEAWSVDEPRLRSLVGEYEAGQVFRLPIPNAEGVPGMALLEGKPVVPPAGMPECGIRLGMSVARIKGVPLPITQAQEDRRRHTYIVGKTGMGKSTLLMTLILQDIEAGRGVFLLDPHGDLAEDVLARIPANRAGDVIVLDPSDSERPLGLNILDAASEADQHRVVNEFIGLLMRLYDPHNQAIVGPIFQQTVRNAMLAAMALPGGTLIDVYRLLSDDQYIQRVLPYIHDPLVRTYWQEITAKMDSASAHWKAELLPYLLSKFSRFVEDSTLRRMIGQPRTSIDWGAVMDEGKIVLVNLAKGHIGQENSQFIGSLVLSQMLQAAFKRGELPLARRKEFYLYIDEVQNYSTPLLATMLSEGRKFGVILTIANQFLHQLDNGIREAVFGNVGSLVAFRVGAQDAPALAPEFYPVFNSGDLLNLPQFTACVKLLIDGMAARPFSLRTFPAMLAPDYGRAEAIRERSRQRYGTDIAVVQAEIQKKF